MGTVGTGRARAVLQGYDVALYGSELAAPSRRAYRSRVSGYLAWLTAAGPWKGDPLGDTEARDRAVEGYRRWLRTARGAKPASVNATLTALDHFYEHLRLGRPTAVREEAARGEPRVLSADEQRTFLRAVEDQRLVRDRAIALLLFYTGIRVAELVALDLADLRLAARPGLLVVREGRRTRPREIPLHADRRPVLRAWTKERDGWRGAKDTEALFLNQRGGRLSTRSVDDLVARIGSDAGLGESDTAGSDSGSGAGGPVTPNALRHTFGTRLLDRGADIVTVSELLGHQRLDTTRRYAPAAATDREHAIALLADDP